MKRIDVQNQPVLSPGRIFQIAVTGVKYRLFRAIVTVAVIVVAMAFLMNILTESLIKRAVADSVREQIEDLHRVDWWIARLSMPQSAQEILRRLAAEDGASADLNELSRVGGISLETIAGAQAAAAESIRYLDFFEQLNFGRRRVLVGPVEGVAIFDRLRDEAHWHTFQRALADMRTIRFPAPLEEFEAFLSTWPALETIIADVRSGQEHLIATIRAELGDRSVMDALKDADGAFGDRLRQAGFELSADDAAGLSRDVARLEQTLLIEATINHAGMRQAIAAERDVLPGDVTMQMIWRLLRNQDRAEWFLEVMRGHELETGGLTGAELQTIADQRQHARLLTIAEQQTLDASGGGLMGIGTRMTWLAMVSMLVCAVGIANAMLMSVTERFREIATLKCLGALDAFIMSVFLIEAGLLGLIGGLGGALAGLILATGRMAVTFRNLLWPAFPGQEILVAALISIGVGMLLAAISAVYPSFRAARLAPMEAMRIE